MLFVLSLSIPRVMRSLFSMLLLVCSALISISLSSSMYYSNLGLSRELKYLSRSKIASCTFRQLWSILLCTITAVFVTVLTLQLGDYYKLPGCGIEEGESSMKALERELAEEVGVKGNPKVLLAKVEEFRGDLHQISDCFLVEFIEGIGGTSMTAIEQEEGLSCQWVSLLMARKLMNESKPTTELGRFIKTRDLFFLEKWLDISGDGKCNGKASKYFS